ncbi:Inorganic triphosphatase YgiF, contains CYTH and CHAD domains [Bosea sp. 62]|nr:Inorganic triphosphatase YgiF, contains CYTH and CHAD domains [Bosea sp. 21B]CAD5286660.1 Inorganic triphosphatase YgiF, contains CYTH and CHAD domains [Bosea sp. 7B]CAD5301285.1 Inorganic triphosphatase YgiF, contains CYTH and CHAD domains [Bosea sp. 46]VVT57384.1 Inorganic triphosphatase YgiF, contains CYTH and CHAD domains [Bosea sp. EC-HK365B]VXB67503.1 Inorganic triphosphatase YgiF, contains CYTH and CHAD domains [Bosea sp. 125]VXC69062.1 Inorganic triphosphatase YgiF, contains CYTH an
MDAVPRDDAAQLDAVAASEPQKQPPREIELKLAASPDALETLRGADLIARHARNQGVTRRLDAVYYDTPDRLLDRNGLALRVRRSGKRHVQTLKRSGSGDPLARDEWEVALPDAALDLALLPLAEIGEPLASLSAGQLAPVFATRIRRRLRRLDYAGALIEIAFDDGTIEAGEKTLQVSEVELELKEGEAAALYELGLAMLDVAPLQLATQSKSARGYGLAFARLPQAVKAKPVEIGEHDNADAAIAAILANTHKQLLGNLAPVVTQSGPEGVHQMRVSLRRLRSALSVLKREVASPAFEPIGREAKRLGHVLGPARNWDVFITQTVPDIEADSLNDAGLSLLCKAAEPHQTKSYADIAKRLANPQTSRFLLSFGALIERRGWRSGLPSEAMAVLAEPADDFAGRVLARTHRQALKRGRGFGSLRPEGRHELRLALKKLRYTAEFFLPLHDGAAARRYLARLSRLQEALGLANDAATTQHLLAELRGGKAPGSDLHFAAGAIHGWQSRHTIEAGRKLKRRWRRFEAASPFWS